MNLNFRYIGDNLLVELSGDIDEFASRALRTELDKLIESPRIRCMTLDMGAVTFVDSTGLGLIIGRYKNLRARGAELVLKNVPPQVDRVFRTSGVYTIAPKID